MKPDVKRVQFDAESDEELTEHKVRQVKTNSTSPIQELQLKYDAMDTRMGNTEKHITSIKSDISRIMTSLSSSNRDRERSRSTSPRHSPSREVQCYTCREYGHYSSTCPKKNLSPMKRNRSSSPSETRTDLNTNGLKM